MCVYVCEYVRACMYVCVVLCACVCELTTPLVQFCLCTLLYDISCGVPVLTMSNSVSAASDRKKLTLIIVCLLLAIIFVVLVVVLAIRFKREYHIAAQRQWYPFFNFQLNQVVILICFY